MSLDEPEYSMPVLSSHRLLLRGLCKLDLPHLFACLSDPLVCRWTPWDRHQSLEDSDNFFEHVARRNYFRMIPDPLAITLKDTPERGLLGVVGAYWYSRDYRIMELEYHLSQSAWGQGYAAEAAMMVRDYVFANVSDVVRLQARVVAQNTGAVRVAEKVGLKQEGCLRSYFRKCDTQYDIIILGMTRFDWEENHKPPLDERARANS